MDDVEVRDRRTDIASGDVATTERGDELTHREEEVARLVAGGIAPDDGLAAAVIESGERVLVAHGLRQQEGIGHHRLLVGVRAHATSTK